MSVSAIRRLMSEYKEMAMNPPEGIVAGPIREDALLEWDALITGPPGTPYEGGVFSARLTFPSEYPLVPPSMKFTCPMWHPNVYRNGDVCISILHAPGEDPNHYEKSEERWSPIHSVRSILLSVISMLAEPNDESSANVDAAKMWREDRKKYEERVLDTVKKSLGL